jgi:hypothetical protein
VVLEHEVTWESLAHVDDHSTLHRWITVDHWGEADLVRELHSWRTIGEMAATGLPMTIHVIEIGQNRNGRRSVAWARAYKHPTMANLGMHFKGKDPKAFKGWRHLYLADSKMDPDAWAEQLWKEGAAQELLHDIRVKVPSEKQCAAIKREIVMEAQAMERVKEPWSELPMSRNACDVYVPCPFQQVCYTDVVNIGELGIYQRREAKFELARPIPLGAHQIRTTPARDRQGPRDTPPDINAARPETSAT